MLFSSSCCPRSSVSQTAARILPSFLWILTSTMFGCLEAFHRLAFAADAAGKNRYAAFFFEVSVGFAALWTKDKCFGELFDFVIDARGGHFGAQDE